MTSPGRGSRMDAGTLSHPACVGRRSRSRETRARIMHTAKIMLRRHSFGALSMTKLAFQSGLSRATIYDQFNDKFHLFREVVKNTIDELSLEYKIELNIGMDLDDAM